MSVGVVSSEWITPTLLVLNSATLPNPLTKLANSNTATVPAASAVDVQELGWGVGRNVLIDTRWSEDNADRSGNRVSTWPRETGHQRRGARPCQPKLISAIAVIVSISAITRFTSWASLAGRAGAQPQASDAGDARGG